MMIFSLPSPELLRQQAEWLAPMRARLLRRVAIAHYKRVLDLGVGYGAVTQELVRRTGGQVVCLDVVQHTFFSHAQTCAGALGVCGDGCKLPFADAMFDMVFCQCVLLWVADVGAVIGEVWRVLQPGGVFVALEPDYGGMMEYPAHVATRALWLSALRRAGAQPYVGRMLPSLFARCGFEVRVDLLPELLPPVSARFAFLRGLPLSRLEQAALRRIERHTAQLTEPWQCVAHVPFVAVTGVRCSGNC